MRLQERRVLRRLPPCPPGPGPPRWPAARPQQGLEILLGGRRLGCRRRGLPRGCRSAASSSPPRPAPPPSSRNGSLGRPGSSAMAHSTPAASSSGCGLPKICLLEIRAQPGVGAGAGDDQAARNRNHQRRNHRHQAVADGQHRIGLERLAQIHAVLQHADQEAGDDVDAGDQDAGHGVALGEARGAVHGAVEFGFGGQLLAAPARLRSRRSARRSGRNRWTSACPAERPG